ncbi:uncharacterized protein LY89DRAFT_781056 [Mollisia scopiformis]|uniref:Uncharacterized protein n=1 Tax=Mollisia scopiformis TaxID=149040 RepID=A0A194XCP2_MOLSC|nr:uncharacterized protein LY89DRAFT_781056 [Mollisia scopiformis]KUJ17929.1 hypothetical protein LY89DRAFT_781056 [Mollisia scopiformis]
MDKVTQYASDVERKLTRINHTMSKGVSKLSMNDLIKQARQGNSVKHAIKKGIKSTDKANPSDAEAREFLAQMNRLVDLEVKQMDLTIQSKPQFDKLHCSGFVRRHLEKSEGKGSCLDMANVLIERSAPDLLPELQALQWKEYNKFHEMLAYYSGSAGGEELVDDERD